MKNLRPVLALAILATSGCAVSYRMMPLESPPATVRYDHGAATVSLTQRGGGVQITPITLLDNKLAFAVAAYNDSNRPANFGVEDIEVLSPDGKLLHVYSADELIHEEQNEALAESIGLAVLGAAGVAASTAAAHETYHGNYHTPHGNYHYKDSHYDPGVAIAGSALSVGAAGAGIYAVQRSLDETIAGIGQSVLQTTTVDPGKSVGGRVFVRRPNSRQYPQQISMTVHWNGESYPFQFEIRKIE